MPGCFNVNKTTESNEYMLTLLHPFQFIYRFRFLYTYLKTIKFIILFLINILINLIIFINELSK